MVPPLLLSLASSLMQLSCVLGRQVSYSPNVLLLLCLQ